jgi:hypothetical protein
VLELFSTNGNLELLQCAGFKDVMTVMKYVAGVLRGTAYDQLGT